MFPILAHADTGSFVNEKGSIADVQFTSKIGDYIEENSTNEPIELEDNFVEDFLDACYFVNPKLSNSWSQGSPYDKYVIQEHPGCPVGCVAIATGMIMSKCKDEFTYHNINFDFSEMNEGITNSDSIALDQAAKLVYWIGQDVNMQYTTGGSGARSEDAYNLLNSLGYNIKNESLVSYCIDEMVKDIKHDYIIYIRGENTVSGLGHAWVADGCQYCTSANAFHSAKKSSRIDVVLQPETIINPYLHCDWGWGGNGNGYFTGDVFSVGTRAYGQMQYFSVKIGNSIPSIVQL